MEDLAVRSNTIKLLEENVGEELLDVNPGSDFLMMTPKAQATKSKTNGTTSNQKALTNKTISKMKRQPMAWEKVFANHLVKG